MEILRRSLESGQDIENPILRATELFLTCRFPRIADQEVIGNKASIIIPEKNHWGKYLQGGIVILGQQYVENLSSSPYLESNLSATQISYEMPEDQISGKIRRLILGNKPPHIGLRQGNTFLCDGLINNATTIDHITYKNEDNRALRLFTDLLPSDQKELPLSTKLEHGMLIVFPVETTWLLNKTHFYPSSTYLVALPNSLF